MSTATIRRQIEADQLKAETSYRELVVAALDNDPDPKRARQILHAAGKSIDDFESDVERLKQRHKAAHDLKEAANFDKRIAEAGKKMTEAAEALNATRERHEQELREASKRFHEQSYAVDELRDKQARTREQATRVLATTYAGAIDEEIERLRGLIDQHEQSLRYQTIDLEELNRFQGQVEERHRRVHGEEVPLPEPSRRHCWLRDENKRLTGLINDLEKQIDALEASKADPANMQWS